MAWMVTDCLNVSQRCQITPLYVGLPEKSLFRPLTTMVVSKVFVMLEVAD